MGFREGAYASVLSVQKGRGNYYDVNLSVNKKDKQTGQYFRDFSGFVMFIGSAANEIAKLNGQNFKNNGFKPLARIKLGEVDTSNTYNAETRVTYTHHKVFTFTWEGANNTVSNTGAGGTNTTNNAQNDTADINSFVNTVPEDEEGLFT